MSDTSDHVTVNGAPLVDFVDKEKVEEIEKVRRSVIAAVSRRRPTITRTAAGAWQRHGKDSPAAVVAQSKIIREFVERHPNGVALRELFKIPGVNLSRPAMSKATRLAGCLTILRGTRLGGLVRLLKPGETIPVRARRTKVQMEAARTTKVERAIFSGTEEIAPLPPPAPRLTLQANTIRHELHSFAHAMQKIEARRAKYMEKLAAAHPGVGYLRILSRLERGHASLWTTLMDRLTGLVAEPTPSQSRLPTKK